MPTITCRNCSRSLDVSEADYSNIKNCPFCGESLSVSASQAYNSLGNAIYGAVSYFGIEIVKDPSRLAAALSDLAYSIPKDVRIFKKTFVGGFDDYSSYLSLAFESEQAAFLPALRRFHHLLMTEEGLSEDFADMLCYSIYSASRQYRKETPLSLDELFQHRETPKAKLVSPAPPATKLQEQKPVFSDAGISSISGRIPAPPVRNLSSAERKRTDSLLGQGYMLLSQREWSRAGECFERVLRIDSSIACAYLGLAMAESSCTDQAAFYSAYSIPGSALSKSANVMRAKQYGSSGLEALFDELRDKAKAKKYEEEEGKRISKLAKEQEAQRAKNLVPILRDKYGQAARMISCGELHTVAIREDGFVIASGDNKSGQCNVQSWKDIVAISTGPYHTVGVRRNGTVTSAGKNTKGQCDLYNWHNIVAVAAGYEHTVGLKEDGTCIAVGNNEYGQCNVSGWTNIVAVSADYWHTVGLRKDGTVVAVGQNNNGECNVSGWHSIVDVKAGFYTTVGLRGDGTVVAVGENSRWQCDVSSWRNIIAIAAHQHTVGLQADGRVVAVGNNQRGQCQTEQLAGIIAVAAGADRTIAMTPNGTFVPIGGKYKEQVDVCNWRLFTRYDSMIDRLERERTERIAQLRGEEKRLRDELDGLSGLFSGFRRRDIEGRLAQVKQELSYRMSRKY